MHLSIRKLIVGIGIVFVMIFVGWRHHQGVLEERRQAALEAARLAAPVEVEITFPEGWNVKQMGERAQEQFSQVTEEEWALWTGPKSPLKEEKIAAGIPKNVGMEGYLFPDTYRFFEDATAEDITRTLLKTFVLRLSSVGPIPESASATFRHNLTLHEFVTLASIVEREVRTDTSMKNVADIFLKRLKRGMALQADSTVNYVTGGTRPSVTFKETEIDSPYNTYRFPGLPPGPIANPGLRSLKNTWEPTPNRWWYFLTNDAGEVFYAETFEKHLINKQNHL